MKIPFYVEIGVAILIGFGLYKLASPLAVIYVVLVILWFFVSLIADPEKENSGGT